MTGEPLLSGNNSEDMELQTLENTQETPISDSSFVEDSEIKELNPNVITDSMWYFFVWAIISFIVFTLSIVNQRYLKQSRQFLLVRSLCFLWYFIIIVIFYIKISNQ